MKVLSLFDGISCARVALERAGIPVEVYYAKEVDKYAIQISTKNYPDIVQLGSVVDFHPAPLICRQMDLIIGGSPCQDLSIAKKNRKGLDGKRSGLFWEYARILKEVKPKYFILENVNSMPKEAKAIITEALGVEPIMINAALVSAQNRKRLFWCGKLMNDKYETIPITQPVDRGILLKDILEQEVDEKYFVHSDNWYFSNFKGALNNGMSLMRVGQIGKGGQADRIYSPEGKSVGLSALGGGRGAKTGLYLINPKMQNFKKNYDKSTALTSSMWKEPPKIVNDENTQIRKLTPTECEKLQGVPDNYTEGVSNTQRYKMLGNAFNVDVVAHILSCLEIKG